MGVQVKSAGRSYSNRPFESDSQARLFNYAEKLECLPNLEMVARAIFAVAGNDPMSFHQMMYHSSKRRIDWLRRCSITTAGLQGRNGYRLEITITSESQFRVMKDFLSTFPCILHIPGRMVDILRELPESSLCYGVNIQQADDIILNEMEGLHWLRMLRIAFKNRFKMRSDILKPISTLKSLQYLDLAYANLGTGGELVLSPLAKCRELRILNLGSNALGEAGSKVLIPLIKLEQLRILMLYDNDLMKAGGTVFAPLEQLKALEEWYLVGNGLNFRSEATAKVLRRLNKLGIPILI